MFYKIMSMTLLFCIYSQVSFAQNTKAHSISINVSAIFQPTYVQTVQMSVPTSGEPATISLNLIRHSENIEAGDYTCPTKNECEIIFY